MKARPVPQSSARTAAAAVSVVTAVAAAPLIAAAAMRDGAAGSAVRFVVAAAVGIAAAAASPGVACNIAVSGGAAAAVSVTAPVDVFDVAANGAAAAAAAAVVRVTADTTVGGSSHACRWIDMGAEVHGAVWTPPSGALDESDLRSLREVKQKSNLLPAAPQLAEKQVKTSTLIVPSSTGFALRAAKDFVKDEVVLEIRQRVEFL